jgi:hypothetical protein
MDSQIVAVFCLCDDLLKALHHHEDPQCQMKDAEVMTAAIVALLCMLLVKYLAKRSALAEVQPWKKV